MPSGAVHRRSLPVRAADRQDRGRDGRPGNEAGGSGRWSGHADTWRAGGVADPETGGAAGAVSPGYPGGARMIRSTAGALNDEAAGDRCRRRLWPGRGAGTDRQLFSGGFWKIASRCCIRLCRASNRSRSTRCMLFCVSSTLRITFGVMNTISVVLLSLVTLFLNR